MNDLRSWIGRQETRDDVTTAAPLMATTLDHDKTTFDIGDEVPQLWHWTYFPPSAPTRDLGLSGHPQKAGFLPPIPQPQQMWAEGQTRKLRAEDNKARCDKRNSASRPDVNGVKA